MLVSPRWWGATYESCTQSCGIGCGTKITPETNTCKKKLNQKLKPQPPRKHLNFLASMERPNKLEALTFLFALSFVWNLAREERSRCFHQWEVESPPKLLAPDTTKPPSFSTPSSPTTQFRMALSPSTRSTSSSTVSAWSAPSTQDMLGFDDDENPFSWKTEKVFTLFKFSSNMNESEIFTVAGNVFKL